MQYFIGVVPPDEYQRRIVAFQKRWSNNRLYEVVEPHITVKAQGGLTLDLDWLDRVKDVCESVPCFRLFLTEPQLFGNEVLYLGTKSQEVVELHRRLVNAVSPVPELIQQYFELELYTPHLTLGQTYWGMTESELEEMRYEARTDLMPFPTFVVTFVRIYREMEPNKYEPFKDIQLSESLTEL